MKINLTTAGRSNCRQPEKVIDAVHGLPASSQEVRPLSISGLSMGFKWLGGIDLDG
jgi:hypothetical protein